MFARLPKIAPAPPASFARPYKGHGYDEHTKLLLHMDGADGGLIFTDETGKTVTRYGHTCTKTAIKVFGVSSGYLDGNGDYLTVPDSEDFTLGSADFTVDFRMYSESTGQHRTIRNRCNSSGQDATADLRILHNSGGGLDIALFYVGGSKGVSTIGAISENTWHHVAVVRYQNTMYLFINGKLNNSVGTTGITAIDSTYAMTIGRNGDYNGWYFKGYIEEYRHSKGIARWTADFLPPTMPYVKTQLGFARR